MEEWIDPIGFKGVFSHTLPTNATAVNGKL